MLWKKSVREMKVDCSVALDGDWYNDLCTQLFPCLFQQGHGDSVHVHGNRHGSCSCVRVWRFPLMTYLVPPHSPLQNCGYQALTDRRAAVRLNYFLILRDCDVADDLVQHLLYMGPIQWLVWCQQIEWFCNQWQWCCVNQTEVQFSFSLFL